MTATEGLWALVGNYTCTDHPACRAEFVRWLGVKAAEIVEATPSARAGVEAAVRDVLEGSPRVPCIDVVERALVTAREERRRCAALAEFWRARWKASDPELRTGHIVDWIERGLSVDQAREELEDHRRALARARAGLEPRPSSES